MKKMSKQKQQQTKIKLIISIEKSNDNINK